MAAESEQAIEARLADASAVVAHGLGRVLGNPPRWQAVTSILTAKASDESACPGPFSLASN